MLFCAIVQVHCATMSVVIYEDKDESLSEILLNYSPVPQNSVGFIRLLNAHIVVLLLKLVHKQSVCVV